MTSPLDRIADLAAALAATDLDSMELAGPNGRVRLQRGAGGIETAAEAEASPSGPGPGPGPESVVVASPSIGHFRRAHPLHEAPLAAEGDEVAAGQTLGLVQVGAVFVPVPAPRAGTVVAIRRADGALTGFGDPLFDLSSDGVP